MKKKFLIFLLAATILTCGCKNTYLNTDTEKDNETPTDFEIEITSDDAKQAEIDDSVWYLTLVNFEYALPDDFSVELAKIDGGISVDARIIDNYNAMRDAAKTDGVILNPCSGYRSVEYQKDLFTRRVKEHMIYGYNQEDSEKIVATYTARPGRSEHNLGLAIDFYDSSTALTEDFELTDQGKWLRENSYKYGFIMRYSSDKMNITAITYEPWHFRFVGIEDAAKIYESGLCLEEYLGKVGSPDFDISNLTTTARSTTTTDSTASKATKSQTTTLKTTTTQSPTTTTTTTTTNTKTQTTTTTQETKKITKSVSVRTVISTTSYMENWSATKKSSTTTTTTTTKKSTTTTSKTLATKIPEETPE